MKDGCARLVMFSLDTLENDPGTFVAMIVIALLAIAIDLVWTHIRARGGTTTPSAPAESVRAG